MAEILLGSHVGMSGKEMFLGSVKEAAEYGANALMVYTGAPQNTRRKEIKDLNLEAGLAYADKAGIKEIVIHAPYIINLGNMEKPEMFDFGVEFLAKEESNRIGKEVTMTDLAERAVRQQIKRMKQKDRKR